jgi:SAM-dependent methyltransferase
VRVLDAGCGEYGLANFIPQVTSVDIDRPARLPAGRNFVKASITALPFEASAFPAVASVDVLEHLPPEARDKAIRELVRVALNTLIVAFPVGAQAEGVDREFHNALVEREQPEPDWLVEHLSHPYPTVEAVLAQIREAAADRRSEVSVSYSEDIRVTRLLRRAAVHSKFLYMGLNLVAGVLSPIIPRPVASNSYRAIITVKFQ